MDPKKPRPRRRGRHEKPLVIHPDDVQQVLDGLRPKLKAEPERGEKPKAKPKTSGGNGKRKS
jgi:hypothetical protein